jgi:hypothetical protein
MPAVDTRPPTVRISAGTAIKIGFLGAFGAMLFSLIVTVIAAVLALLLGAAALLPMLQDLTP